MSLVPIGGVEVIFLRVVAGYVQGLGPVYVGVSCQTEVQGLVLRDVYVLREVVEILPELERAGIARYAFASEFQEVEQIGGGPPRKAGLRQGDAPVCNGCLPVFVRVA